MKRLLFFLKDKSDLISFWSGIISSFACTIVYEAIVELSDINSIVAVQYVLKWLSSVLMITCSIFLLSLASKFKELEAIYNRLWSLSNDSERDDWICLFNAALNKQTNIPNIKNEKRLITKDYIMKICMVFLLFLIAFFTLFLAQVVI